MKYYFIFMGMWVFLLVAIGGAINHMDTFITAAIAFMITSTFWFGDVTRRLKELSRQKENL